jgi:hypothetical protein
VAGSFNAGHRLGEQLPRTTAREIINVDSWVGVSGHPVMATIATVVTVGAGARHGGLKRYHERG